MKQQKRSRFALVSHIVSIFTHGVLIAILLATLGGCGKKSPLKPPPEWEDKNYPQKG